MEVKEEREEEEGGGKRGGGRGRGGGLSSIGGNSLLSRLEACSIEMEVPLQTRITVVSGSELGGLSEQGTSCEKGTVPVVLDL